MQQVGNLDFATCAEVNRFTLIIICGREQDAFGDETNPGAEAGLFVEPNLVADFLAEGSAALPRQTGGHSAGSDPAVDEAVALAPLIEAMLRQDRTDRTSIEETFCQLRAAMEPS